MLSVGGDPDLNQVAADAVAVGKRVRRLSAQELLDDLPLELDRMGAVLNHGLSPRKPGSVSRFSGPLPVHPKGCTSGIGANLTNEEKRAHLIDLRREHLIDK